ncbi:MAG: hypothetical protein HQ515_21935, partial [Phycisphaeraceae bacterium]|nr:hypothetical protein [Phycisphaeraceae bacterium]
SSQDPNAISPSIEHPAVKILGEIFVMGQPVSNVLIETDPGVAPCTTDANGLFEVEVPYGWSGAITPAKAGWVFDPPYRAFHNIRRNIDERLDHTLYLAEDMPEASLQDEPTDGVVPPAPSVPLAWGRLGVTPMLISLKAHPGETLNASFAIQNMDVQSPNVTLALAELQQAQSGGWTPAAASSPALHSCRPWLVLNLGAEPAISLPAMDTITCPLEIQVPDDAQGFYSAAILVQPQDKRDETGAFKCSMVVPVLVHVESDEIVADVKIENLELRVPFMSPEVKQPRIRLTLKNQGATLSRFNASVTVATETETPSSQSEHSMAFNDRWIMPGASLTLETDYVGPHPTQQLTLQGHLEIIKEETFTKRIPGAQDKAHTNGQQASNIIAPTNDPAQTLAMIDYNQIQTLHLEQCPAFGNPFETYSGQCHMGMATNFQSTVQASIQGCSPAQGDWTVIASPSSVQQPSHVLLTVLGTHVAIKKLDHANNVLVAKLTVQLIPKIGLWPPASRATH